jgi:PKD repeat protein
VPLTVNFTATNVGQSNIDSWSWVFGDGGTSTERNPTHIYNTAGTFTAQVTATGIGGSVTESIVITPFTAPAVSITANPQSGEAPLTVTFTANNTGGPVATWHWDFGDGDTSDVQNPPPHTYSAVGTYNVVLTATNAAGSSSDTVSIEALPAMATLTMTVTGQGTTTPPVGDTLVAQGEDVSISATPATGYEFVSWSVTAGSVTIANPTQSSTTVQLSGDATINAGFALTEYTLTVTSGPNGTTSPSGAVPAQHGVPIAVAATPDSGFKFAVWTVETGTATIANPASANTNVILESGDAGVLASFIEDAGAVPYNRMLSITGTLYDENGDPVGYPDPIDIDATIRLTTEENGGDTVYTESFYEGNGEAVTVDNGLFVARLGSGTSTDNLQTVLSAYENLFVEITVEEQVTPDVLLPRTPLTAGAFTLTGPPALSELNLNTIHGSGDPNDAGIEGRIGMYYIDDETGMTWLRVNSKWILLE